MRKYVYVFSLLLVGVAIFSISYRESERQQQQMYEMASAESTICYDMTKEEVEEIRKLMIIAIDEAFKDHVSKMYEVWMKDDTGQPGRAAAGVRQGLKAYLGAKKALKEWDPRLCF